MNTRLFITIGAERPPYGAFQARFSPESDHFDGKPFSGLMPSRAGPRQSAQSLATAETARNRMTMMQKYLDGRFVILDLAPDS
jgi:hypothetical protein